jgi:hypothetical protein
MLRSRSKCHPLLDSEEEKRIVGAGVESLRMGWVW